MPSAASAGNFNVVILYDYLEAARLAAAAYAHLARELETEFSVKLHIWRIDVADSADCVQYADDDIAAADMVILAVRDTDSCLSACRKWTDKPRDRLGLPRQALVAIIADEQKAPLTTGTWDDVLRSTIEKTPLDAFLWRSPASSFGQMSPVG
jgi:hypothetical protein